MKLEIIGERFGRLTTKEGVDPHVTPSGHKTRRYLCACDCGKDKVVLQNALRSGATQSCGCLQAESVPCLREGAKGLRVGCDREDYRYNVWSMMVQRCYEENHDSYPSYGGSGKLVCDRWLQPRGEGFKNFCSDMGLRPYKNKFDRVDNDLGYTPDNCRWVDDKTSVINRGISRNNTSGCKGVVWNRQKNKWQAQITVDYRHKNLGLYSDWFDAVCARKSAELIYFREVFYE